MSSLPINMFYRYIHLVCTINRLSMVSVTIDSVCSHCNTLGRKLYTKRDIFIEDSIVKCSARALLISSTVAILWYPWCGSIKNVVSSQHFWIFYKSVSIFSSSRAATAKLPINYAWLYTCTSISCCRQNELDSISNYVTSCILSSYQCRGRMAGVRRSSIMGSIFFMRSMSSFRRSQTSHCSNYLRKRIMSLRIRYSSSNIFSLFNFMKYMVFHCTLAYRHSFTRFHICFSSASWD